VAAKSSETRFASVHFHKEPETLLVVCDYLKSFIGKVKLGENQGQDLRQGNRVALSKQRD